VVPGSRTVHHQQSSTSSNNHDVLLWLLAILIILMISCGWVRTARLVELLLKQQAQRDHQPMGRRWAAAALPCLHCMLVFLDTTSAGANNPGAGVPACFSTPRADSNAWLYIPVQTRHKVRPSLAPAVVEDGVVQDRLPVHGGLIGPVMLRLGRVPACHSERVRESVDWKRPKKQL
jgi:hypothetical protein